MNPALSTKARSCKLRKSGVKPFVVKPASAFKGKITLSGDKSIAHRAVIISAISSGSTSVANFPLNEDCLATVNAFRKLGIKINKKISGVKKVSALLIIEGSGLFGLHKSKQPIFVGASGTTIRLLLGVLAGQRFKTKLIAGESLSNRPMLRVNRPLRMMGAEIKARRKIIEAKQEESLPIVIKGGNLNPITYKMPVASAQVKSAIILAGLYANGKTCLFESVPTRDHTERMLKLFKASIKVIRNKIVVEGRHELKSPKKIYIPGDISSAAFFLVLAAIIPGSKITVSNVILNPLRCGIVEVLIRMGAGIKITRSKDLKVSEPMGSISICSSRLKAATVRKEEMPHLIDELPVLMVAACYAEGQTLLEGANELRVKETDRINSMVSNLRKMGAEIEISKRRGLEFIKIKGKGKLDGAKVKSFQDHRTAMSLIVAGLAAKGFTEIDDVSCISKSFPGFIKILKSLRR